MTEKELKKLEEFEDIFGNTPFQNIQKIKEYIQNNFVSVDLYNKEKEKNTFGVVSKDKIKDLFKKYENEHFIPKAEIQELLEKTNE